MSEAQLGDKPPIDFDSLPEDPVDRRRKLERRAEPSETRPTLDPEYEALLAAVEEKHAQLYLDAEELTYRIRNVAKKVLEWVPSQIPRAQTDS